NHASSQEDDFEPIGVRTAVHGLHSHSVPANIDEGGPSTNVGPQRRVSHRGSSFNKEEDELLISCVLNTSKDAAVGTNQTSGAYWFRIHAEYHKYNKAEGFCDRTDVSLNRRWGHIQKEVNKF